MSRPILMGTVESYIRREQVLRLARQLPVNILANLAVVTTFIVIYFGQLATLNLVLWVFYSQLVNLFGLYLSRRYRNSVEDQNINTCLWCFSIYAIADSLTFAMATWLFFIPDGGLYNVFLFTVLLGIGAGGQTTLLSHLYSAIPFSLIITLMTSIRLLAAGEPDYNLLAVMALVFSGVLIRIALSFNHNLLSTWRLRYELEAELKERKKMERQLRDSEQRYRDIVEMSPDAILIQQGDSIVFANDTALAILEVDTVDTLKGHSILEYLRTSSSNPEPGPSDEVWKQLADEDHVELKLQTARSRELDIQLRIKMVKFNSEPAWQLTIQDISERKQMDAMKDEFISVVSHELRTPITAILGAAGIMRGMMSEKMDEKQRQLINIVYNNSFTLSYLVNDILDVSKLKGGKLSFRISEYDINDILEEVIKDNETYASQYNVELILKRDLAFSLIETDRLRFKQILNNVISNAIKHSPENDRVEVNAMTSEGEILLSVRDHGSGIPKEFQHRIFNKFEQSQEIDRRVIKGTGLGLFLTKSLVEQFNGEIWYETEEGHGTSFYIKLPA